MGEETFKKDVIFYYNYHCVLIIQSNKFHCSISYMHIQCFDHICLPYYGKVYFELDLLYCISK